MAHLKTLCYKNFLIFRTNYKKYIQLYLSPLLVLLTLILLQNWANTNANWEDRDRPIRNLQPIPLCHGHQCLTIGYKVHGPRQPYIDYVISHISTINGLKEEDIKEWKMEPEQIMRYLQQNVNKTQLVIVFCTREAIKFGNISVPCYGDDFHLNFYTIIYNLTLFHRVPFLSNLHNPYPIDEVTLKLKQDIDEGIIQFYYGKEQLSYNMTVSEFPARSSRFINGVNVTSQYGSFFFMIPFLILLVMEGSHMLKQKQNRLRIGLNIVGVSHFQFYLSEIITYLFHVLIISLNFCIFGFLLDFKFWSNSLLWFSFLVLLTNGIIIGLLAFCVTALVAQRNLGMAIIYGFVLYSIVMQWLFTGGFVFQFLYFQDAGWPIIIIRYILNCYPSYHFSKIFTDVSKKADTHFDTWNNSYVQGTLFTYADLFEQRSRSFEFPTPRTYIIPSTMETFVFMLSTSLIYFTALIFLDIFVQSNRGYRHHFLKDTRKNSLYEDQNSCILNVTNLQKTYDHKKFALRGVSFTINQGQFIGLLGENGAGKSTLINILIGALTATKGRVSINGHNVDQNMTEIRKILGVCPQFDILWEQLTALEHMFIFSKLKNLSQIQATIQSGLEQVNLWENKNGRVSTFSGGMKRRLSLALSFLGNPQLIVLDEPTTGMDVKIRLQTWKMILNMKGKTSILLTTHNMEEAQCLSDRIVILNKGRLVAEGSAQQLKKSFGKGYVIRGLNPQSLEEVVWRCKEDQLEASLEKIQKEGLQNWNLKETTLEEVFLNAINMF